MKNVFSFEGISKQFSTRWVIKNISGSVNQQDRIALIGDNGEGKTTLLNLLAGVYRPQRGAITFSQGRVSFMRQSYFYSNPGMFYSRLSALQNIDFIAKLRGNTNSSKYLVALDYVGLKAVANSRVESFSTGMLQRLNIAAMLVIKPTFLFLDEPFNGLDQKGCSQLSQLLHQKGEEHFSWKISEYIIIDHDRERAASLCDKIWHLKKGSLEINP